jgi:hypothetical protein
MKSAKEILRSTRFEAMQIVDNPDASIEGRKAWYYTHLGEIEFARFMDLLSEEEMRQLEDEWKKHFPQ